MIVESNKVIYSDGRHNAFTSMVMWRDRYWVTFRNDERHRSHEGRVYVISSPDLEKWSGPVVVMDTLIDDRDPHLAVFQDRLFVTSGSIDRRFEDEVHLDGKVQIVQLHTTMTVTDDGVNWKDPWVATEPYHFVWWMMPHGAYIYGTEYVYGGKQGETVTNLIRTSDGHRWEHVSVLSDERHANETSFAFLPDDRALAFVRHEMDLYPEIKIAEPQYEIWESVITMPFKAAGPCLGLVGDTIVVSARAFLEELETPLVTPELAAHRRGLLIMTVDLDRRIVNPQVLIPHSTGPLTPGDPGYHEHPPTIALDPNTPDISYASIVDLGGGRFAMSYYDGYIGGPADIRLLQLRLD